MDNIQLELLAHQDDFFWNDTFATALVSGLGGGKTWIGAAWAVRKALENPEVKGLIFANTYKQLKGATLDRLLDHLEQWDIRYDLNRSEMILYIEGTCRVFLRSTENYDDIRGIEFGWAWGDEVRDLKKEAIDVILGRLRDKRCDSIQLKLTTTPAGLNWIYDYFVVYPHEAQLALEAAGGDIEGVDRNRRQFLNYRLVQAESDDNPFLPDLYIATLDAYDEMLAEQERKGRFVNIYAGNIYRTFEREVHVDGRIAYNPHLPIELTMDFNASFPAPMGCELAQIYPGGQVQVFDEISIPGGSTPEVIDEFLGRYREHDAGVLVYGDATGNQAKSAGKSDYAIALKMLNQHLAELEDAKIEALKKSLPEGETAEEPVVRRAALMVSKKSNPLVVDRTSSTCSKLRDSRKVVSMKVSPRCKELITDWERVTWKPGVRQIDKGDPLRTHHSDAVDYFIHNRFPLHVGEIVGGSSSAASATAMRDALADRRGSIAANRRRQSVSTGRRGRA